MNYIGDIPRVSEEENAILRASFTEGEVKEAIFQMEHNKSLGPNGSPAEFYQHCWDVIKDDLLQVFHDFHYSDLNLFKFNFREIILLLKIEVACRIQQYRPICLLNVSFKVFKGHK